jgi:transaldolase
MIKVPATPAGLDSLEQVAAMGVTINVTLMFTERQYRIARDAIWCGAQRRENGLRDFKSVYSVFVSRVDAYTEKRVPELSRAARGMVGILNAKRIWRENREFWADKELRLQQEIVFASTGVKTSGDPPDKYVEAFAGDGILTNPPATNDTVDIGKNVHAPRRPDAAGRCRRRDRSARRHGGAGARADGGGHPEVHRSAE